MCFTSHNREYLPRWNLISKTLIGWILLLGSLVIVGIHVGATYNKLPRTCVCHFTASEEPLSYCNRAGLVALYIGVVFGFSLLISIICLVIPSCQSGIGLPNRNYWFAPNRRSSTIAFIINIFLFLASVLNAFILILLQMIFSYNLTCKIDEEHPVPCNKKIYLIPIIMVLIFALGLISFLAVFRFYLIPHDILMAMEEGENDGFNSSGEHIPVREFYLLGLLYINTDDPHFFVETEDGYTCNFGSPNVIYVFVIVVMISTAVGFGCTFIVTET